MVEDSDQSDPLTKTVRYGGVIPKGVLETHDFTVKFEVIISTQSLMIGAYSDYQKVLSDSIIQMRDEEKMTFK